MTALGGLQVVLAVGAITICIALLLLPPHWTVGALLFSYSVPFTLVVLRPFGNDALVRLDDILLVIVALRFGSAAARGELTVPRQVAPVLIALLCLVSLQLLSTLSFSIIDPDRDSRDYYYGLKAVQYAAPFFIVMAWPHCWKHRYFLLRALLCGAAVVALYGALEWLEVIPPRSEIGLDQGQSAGFDSGVTSTLSSQHAVIGLYLVMIIPLAGAAAIAARHRGARYGLALFVILLFALLYLSASRSAWIGALAASLLGIVWLSRSRHRYLTAAAGIALSAAILLGFILGSAPTEPLITSLNRFDAEPLRYAESYDVQASTRGTIWTASIELLTEKPAVLLLGTGWGTFPGIATASGAASGAHNAYLTLAVELGIVGLAAFLYFIAQAARRAREMALGEGFPSHLARAFALSLTAVLVSSMFIDTFYPAIALESFLGFFFSVMGIALAPGELRKP